MKRSPSGEMRLLGRIVQSGGGIASESYYGGAWHQENTLIPYLTDPYGVDEIEEHELPRYTAEMDEVG